MLLSFALFFFETHTQTQRIKKQNQIKKAQTNKQTNKQTKNKKKTKRNKPKKTKTKKKLTLVPSTWRRPTDSRWQSAVHSAEMLLFVVCAIHPALQMYRNWRCSPWKTTVVTVKFTHGSSIAVGIEVDQRDISSIHRKHESKVGRVA